MRRLVFILLFIPLLAFGQSEMITNGTFTDASNWTTGTSWSIAGGEAVYDSLATDVLYQADGDMVSSIEASTTYTIEFDISATTVLGAVATILIRSVSNEEYVSITGYTNTGQIFEFTTPPDIGSGGIEFVAFTARPFSIDNVSLKKNAAVGDDPYYVDPAGSDQADGSIGTPWKTFRKALDVADAGDTVYCRDGVYYEERTVTLTNTGTEGNPICFFNYPGETPIFDGKNFVDNMPPNTSGDVYAYGIYMELKQHIKFKGIEMRNILQANNDEDDYWVPTIGAIHGWLTTNLSFENISIHNVGKKGFYIVSGATNSWDSQAEYLPLSETDTTTFLNCDVYDICDSISWIVEEGDTIDTGGNHGDAWKIENWQGTYYTFDDCRAWFYSDDAFDPNHAGYKIYTNCWAMASGKYSDFPSSELNGFKQSAIFTDMVFYDSLVDPTDTCFVKWINCVATFCSNGFYNNLFLGVDDVSFVPDNAVLYNNTAYANENGFYDFTRPSDTITETRFRNNITFGSTSTNCSKPADMFVAGFVDFHRESNNNFDYVYDAGSCPRWEYTDTVTVTSADFVNALDSATIVSEFTAARGSDWSLPVNPFRLAEGSDLIDAGNQIPAGDNSGITLSFFGTAPDIGASESNYGAATSIGTQFYLTPAGGYYKDKNGNPYLFD